VVTKVKRNIVGFHGGGEEEGEIDKERDDEPSRWRQHGDGCAGGGSRAD
jgi:hypothetical protein